MSEEHKDQHTHPEGGEHKTPASESATAGAAPAGEEGKGKGKGKKAKTPKEKKPKAEKPKAEKPKAEKKPPKDGVISTILAAMQRDEGASVAEIADILKKKFPDRKSDGMTTTIRIQVSRLPQRCGFDLKKTQDEKRGLVYKAPKSARLDKKKEKPAPAEGEKK